MRLSAGIELAPAVEAAGDAGSDLRVDRLQVVDDVGGQRVAAAITALGSGLAITHWQNHQ